MEKVRITREELYEMVWEFPMTALSKKFKISDNGLRKICKRMNIPIPANGYWQQLRFKKNVPKMELPKKYTGENEIYLAENEGIEGEEHSISAQNRLRLEILAQSDLPLTVPDRLTNPDKLIISAKQSLTDPENRYGRYEGIISTPSNEICIRVSKGNVGRALRFMDTLIKLLRAREHDIKVDYGRTYAVIEGEKIEILLMEKLSISIIQERWGPRREYIPSGILTFRLDSYYGRTWADGKIPLEDQLVNILAKLEILGKKLKADRIERENRQKEQEEKRRILLEQQERKNLEFSRVKHLISKANQWKQACIVREYLAHLEKSSHKNLEFEDWIGWAKLKADWIDPSRNQQDVLLTEEDKNNIFAEQD